MQNKKIIDIRTITETDANMFEDYIRHYLEAKWEISCNPVVAKQVEGKSEYFAYSVCMVKYEDDK